MRDDTDSAHSESPFTSSPEAFRRAHARYQPDPLRVLFIAEAPPAYRTNRLFYFFDLTTGDALFLEMMKVIYGPELGFTENLGFTRQSSAKHLRGRKAELLKQFMTDGYFLIDASAEPMPDNATTAVKLALLRKSLPDLKYRVGRLIGKRNVSIVLIGGVTYLACYDVLKAEGYIIVNEEMINHPARGGQVLFRQKLRQTLDRVDDDV